MVEAVCKSAALGDDAIELGVLRALLSAVLLILPSWLLSSTQHHKLSKKKKNRALHTHRERERERERAWRERSGNGFEKTECGRADLRETVGGKENAGERNGKEN
jgi:hypothetical protein